ncbi:hypothetical protein V2J09_006582 [Rumex salicifolius]
MMDDNQNHQQRVHDSSSTADLRHLFSPTSMLSAPPPPHQSLFTAASGGAFTPFQYFPMPSDHGLQVNFQSDSTISATIATTTAAVGSGGGSTARWPRQETLTLLEVRSRLDNKFKEANHKGPLWDEASRIMNEEFGYQRSGKKCREKFENLYKYYKKTKDGKGGRQDGKNYRFFRQLESIYGQPEYNQIRHNTSASINTVSMKAPTINVSLHGHHQEEGRLCSVSLSTSSSELQTSSSDHGETNRMKRRGKRSWKSKIIGFIDLQMRKIMEKQETWSEKVMSTVEHKEKERMSRDEEWRKNKYERVEREHMLWAEERAWIEARDRALIDALQSLKGKELVVEDENHLSSSELALMATQQGRKLERLEVLNACDTKKGEDDHDRWEESEITELIQLRTRMDARFEHSIEDMSLWEEIASRMASLGHVHRSGIICKEKWDLVNSLALKKASNTKKRKDDRRIESIGGCSHHQHPQSGESINLYNYGVIDGSRSIGAVPPDIGIGGGNPMSDSFKFLLGND